MNMPRAVLFDMDGTLTTPMLDFPRIKAEMGIGNGPILEALATMSEARRAAAEAVLLRHEEDAAACSTLNPGCRELLDWLASQSIPCALITRNSRTSVSTVIERHGLQIDFIMTRADARPKPDPEALHRACERFGVASADAWMVGDGQYDVEAGLAAGVPTVWISHGLPRPFAASPWRTVRDLHELAGCLRACRTAPR
jgi:HAD superfamily hydrolase (TIGR01509 family)